MVAYTETQHVLWSVVFSVEKRFAYCGPTRTAKLETDQTSAALRFCACENTKTLKNVNDLRCRQQAGRL